MTAGPMLEVLRDLALTGAGLEPGADGRLAVYRPPTCPAGSALTDGIRVALLLNKAMLRALLEPTGLRDRLAIPPDVPPIGPQLAVVLVWLDQERRAFTPDERHRWLERKRALVDEGVPGYLATLFATEAVCRQRAPRERMAVMASRPAGMVTATLTEREEAA
jgi:hypothetical protein